AQLRAILGFREAVWQKSKASEAIELCVAGSSAGQPIFLSYDAGSVGDAFPGIRAWQGVGGLQHKIGRSHRPTEDHVRTGARDLQTNCLPDESHLIKEYPPRRVIVRKLNHHVSAGPRAGKRQKASS